MNQKTEKEIVLYYLNNLLKSSVDDKLEKGVCDWFEESAQELIGRDLDGIWESQRGRWRARREEKEEKEQLLPRCFQTIKKLLNGRIGRMVFTPEIMAMIEAFNLSPGCHDVLALRVHTVNIPLLESLADAFHGNESTRVMACVLRQSRRQYAKHYSSDSELVEKGIFAQQIKDGWSPDVTEMFNDILQANCRTPAAVKRIVLGKPMKATLKPEHFEHIEEEYTLIRDLLSNALTKRQRGVNILIYGPPGTGKTEMTKTLCNEINSAIYLVSGGVTGEQASTARRSDLASALSILRNDKDSVLLMDEAEDVFDAEQEGPFGTMFSRGSSSKSKLFFNRLLENNAIPVIWISNKIKGVDPAHLRRFSYALHMDSTDETVQARIWSHSARKNKVKLSKAKIEELVRSYDIAPGIIDASLRTAALTNNQDVIEKTIESLQRAMNGCIIQKKQESLLAHPFSTELLNCDLDLGKLTQQILKRKGEAFSLCLYGISGSGKSAYARYLAEKLQIKVLHKRASDLMDMYVGRTEQKIAAAFAEAKQKKKLLVLDEADSFLQDRRNAHRSWEVSAVNEMLTQMEYHPLPFVCTTNLMDDLDQASLRRFTFKVKYDYLKKSQVAIAFKHFFGMEPTFSLNDLTCLAPGDFAVVAKQAKIYDISDPRELVERLRMEQQAKDVKSGSLGFAAP